MIRAENLPTAERAKLAADGYLPDGFGETRAKRHRPDGARRGTRRLCVARITVSEEGEVAPNCYWIDGFFGDSREQEPQTPVDHCRRRAQHGRGDQAPPSLVPDSLASRAA